MSNYEQTVKNFIYLLDKRTNLFSEEDLIELNQLISSSVDNSEGLSNLVNNWCEQHPEVDDALGMLEENLGRVPGSKKPNENIPDYKPDKRTLIDVIQQSFPKKETDNQQQPKES